MFQVVEKQLGADKVHSKSKIYLFFRWFVTYILINITWVFFRANSILDSFIVFQKVILVPMEFIGVLTGSRSLGSIVSLNGSFLWNVILGFVGITVLILISTLEQKKESVTDFIAEMHPAMRYTVYFLLLFLTLCFGKFGGESQFIYFRF